MSALTLKEAYRECRLINKQLVDGENTVYFEDNTDTSCSTTIGGTDYHFFDGTSTFLELMKDFLAIKGKKSRHGAYLSYDLTAEDLYRKMKSRLNPDVRNVFFGISRGAPIANGVLTRFIEDTGCENVLMAPIVSPPAGGRKYKKYCSRLGYDCLRIDMRGGVVPFLPPWGKHYHTIKKVCKNKERGFLSKHLNVYEYLPEMWV